MKKTLALTLALVMLLGLMVGCASEPATTPSDTPVTDTPVTETPAEDPVETPVEEPTEDPSEAPAETPAEEPVEEPTEEPVVETQGADVAIPFAETKTFTAWLNNMPLPTGYTDYNELEVWQEAERRTNAHIDWTIPSMANANEQFSLLLTAGEYCDLYAAVTLNGGYDYSIDEEVILDLSELVPVYAPRFYELLCSDETSRRDIYTDTGRLPGLKMVNISYEPNFLGYWVRQDWLDDVGYTDTIETYEDWETVMKLWQDEKGLNNTLFFDTTTGQSVSLMAGFDTGTSMLAFDGEVVFGPMEQNYYDYLALMTRWYTEGYLDHDFVNVGGFFANMGSFATDKYGFFDYFYSGKEVLLGMGRENDEDFALTAVDFPRLNDGDMQRTKMVGNAVSQLGGTYIHLAAQCEEPEAVLQWCDYFYTDEGMLLANYGIEGESYTMVEGVARYTDYIMHNEDGVAESDMRARYSINSFMPQLYDWDRGNQALSEDSKSAKYVWDARWDPTQCITMPVGLSLTTEESEDTSSRLNDINTLVSEYTAKVIIGELDLESTWDGFVADIESMDIEMCIEAYQAAYDRYMAR